MSNRNRIKNWGKKKKDVVEELSFEDIFRNLNVIQIAFCLIFSAKSNKKLALFVQNWNDFLVFEQFFDVFI